MLPAPQRVIFIAKIILGNLYLWINLKISESMRFYTSYNDLGRKYLIKFTSIIWFGNTFPFKTLDDQVPNI